MFAIEDFISIDFFLTLCDYFYEPSNTNPASGVVFCHQNGVNKFFDVCKNFPERKYILVSTDSDFGVVYQHSEHHSNYDVLKCCDIALRSLKITPNDYLEYMALGIDPREKGCNVKHKYAVKVDRLTDSTFDEIPANVVHWFINNHEINDKRIEWIPFGLQRQDVLKRFEKVYAENVQNKKQKMVYANFGLNTVDRANFHYVFYTNKNDKITFRETSNLEYEDYLKELSVHQFVFCPKGTGFDCFRNYETLYLNSIPVMLNSPFAQNFKSMPVLIIDGIGELYDVNFLQKSYFDIKSRQYENNLLKKSYWVERFDKVRKEIL